MDESLLQTLPSFRVLDHRYSTVYKDCSQPSLTLSCLLRSEGSHHAGSKRKSTVVPAHAMKAYE